MAMRLNVDGMTSDNRNVRIANAVSALRYEPPIHCASAIPIRSLKPLSLSAKPIAEPLNTSQNALDAKPENICAVGTGVRSVDRKKNSNDTRSPGMTAVAHNRMHENTIAIIRAFAADILPPITRSRIADKPATSNISVARFFFSNLVSLCLITGHSVPVISAYGRACGNFILLMCIVKDVLELARLVKSRIWLATHRKIAPHPLPQIGHFRFRAIYVRDRPPTRLNDFDLFQKHLAEHDNASIRYAKIFFGAV